MAKINPQPALAGSGGPPSLFDVNSQQGQDHAGTHFALLGAVKGVGLVSPNPLVGCVIVSADGEFVGEGAYIYDNVIHAEAVALQQAGEKARGGTAFVLASAISIAASAAAPRVLLLDGALAGPDVIAVGERGAILRSTDNGKMWDRVSSGVNATLTDCPGATLTRVRSAKIGSSTGPVVPERSPPSDIATGLRTERPRPMNRDRSVSQVTLPTRSRPASTTCTHQRRGSSGTRGRRVAVTAVHHACHSVSTNRFEKAGCARSAPCVVIATSP